MKEFQALFSVGFGLVGGVSVGVKNSVEVVD